MSVTDVRNGSSQHGSMSGRRGESEHSFKANERFDYRKHGYQSLSWSRSRWSSSYHCYCYYAPSYGWCFYEPTYSCYLPVSYYPEVYPQAAPTVSTTPSVIQQQTTFERILTFQTNGNASVTHGLELGGDVHVGYTQTPNGRMTAQGVS